MHRNRQAAQPYQKGVLLMLAPKNKVQMPANCCIVRDQWGSWVV